MSRCDLFALTLALVVPLHPDAAAHKLPAKIIQRHDSTSVYAYMVPILTPSTVDANRSITGSGPAVRTNDSDDSAGGSTPVQDYSYSVRGVTLTLLLPDRRRVVVNCAGKFTLHGDSVEWRDCRKPLVDELEAEFRGDEAKLRWPVRLNRNKSESDTYTILAVLTAD